MNELIDKDIREGPSFLSNDYHVYKRVIDEQRESVAVIQRKVHITTAVVLSINVLMCIVGFYVPVEGHWGMLVSFIGSICVLFNSLARISRTIRRVQNAFPNEGFVWVNVWNLIIFALLLLVTYTVSLVQDIYGMGGTENMTEDEKKVYLRVDIAYTMFDMVQYVFAMYMDMYILYLILRFTKPN